MEKETDPQFNIKKQIELLESKFNKMIATSFIRGNVNDIYNLEEAADYLRTTTSTLTLYAKRKKITYSMIGKKKVFRKRDLEDFIERNLKLHSDFPEKRNWK